MERLTDTCRNADGSGISKKSLIDRAGKGYPSSYTSKIVTKLADYEDLEEQGLLLRLPCKVGDTVYAIGFNNNRPFVYEAIILSILLIGKEIVFNIKVDEFEINSQLKNSMFGRTVFLTKSEAEQKLKEMESGNNGTMEQKHSTKM